eukprot:1189711-Prorocentrum_minimum.AAC.2
MTYRRTNNNVMIHVHNKKVNTVPDKTWLLVSHNSSASAVYCSWKRSAACTADHHVHYVVHQLRANIQPASLQVQLMPHLPESTKLAQVHRHVQEYLIVSSSHSFQGRERRQARVELAPQLHVQLGTGIKPAHTEQDLSGRPEPSWVAQHQRAPARNMSHLH